MKIPTQLTLALVCIFYSLVNVGVYWLLDLVGAIDVYEKYKSRWMPTTGFLLFLCASIIELGFYLFSYPPLDYSNIIFIIACGCGTAVISTYIIRQKDSIEI